MVLRETLNDYTSVDIADLLDVIEMDRMVLRQRETLNDYASVAKKTSLMLWTGTT